MARQAQPDREDGQELLGRLRETTERWALWEHTRSRLTSGMFGLDTALGGGWPCGRVAEIVGPASSGRTGIATATAAAAMRRGEVVAWVDVADAFMPPFGEAAGMDLERVLWVRPSGVGEAVRAVELVLETGGFPVIVLDLTPTHPGWKGGRNALALRLARAVERAGAVVLVLADRPWVGTLAGATVVLERSRALWSASGRRTPRWLTGLRTRLRVERGGFGTVGRTVDLRLSWSAPDTDGGNDADRLPSDTGLFSSSAAAC